MPLQIGIGELLIVKNWIIGLIWRNDSIDLFDPNSKDENGNVPSSGAAVLLKFDALTSLGNLIKPVY